MLHVVGVGQQIVKKIVILQYIALILPQNLREMYGTNHPQVKWYTRVTCVVWVLLLLRLHVYL